MALTAIQKAKYGSTPDILYNEIRGICNSIEQFMIRGQSAAEFINRASVQDLTDMGITDPAIQSLLGDLKNVVNDLVNYYANQAVTPATDPKEVVDSIRNMNVI